MTMLSGTNLQFAKFFNVRIVLETIRISGPISRVDIARHTELTAQTVTNITRELLETGLIMESSKQQDKRGAPSILLKVNPEGAFTVGLDMDEEHLTGVLVDLTGNMRGRITLEIADPTPDQALELMENTTRTLVKRANIALDRIWGVGIGVPGPLGTDHVNGNRKFAQPWAFTGWDHVPLAELLEKRLELPVFLENNASAAAIGERWYGEGRNYNSFFYLFFGSGLGGGIILNGQSYSGYTGNAGELGYYPLQNATDIFPEGVKPHLGRYFNLRVLFNELTSHGFHASHPADLDPLFRVGNPILLKWIETAADRLAPFILGIEYLLDPQAILFGGRLSDPIVRALMNRIEQQLDLLRIDRKVARPELKQAIVGVDAASLGVATLPLYNMMAPIPRHLMKASGKAGSDLLERAGRDAKAE
jgi:predicted NBD/HSP70 family sugar kinase